MPSDATTSARTYQGPANTPSSARRVATRDAITDDPAETASTKAILNDWPTASQDVNVYRAGAVNLHYRKPRQSRKIS
ncbi:hypothetical protein GCM10027610_108140 [Dactylosporangium cerinum]